jgi:23S rRNA (adenine2503-C2)-methyltransferase
MTLPSSPADNNDETPSLSARTPWLCRELDALALSPTHAAPLRRHWLQARPLGDGPWVAQDFLPRRLIEALPRLQAGLDAIARIRSRHAAPDGAERLLIDLHDGQSVETVLLPGDAVCVSSQVGCAVGCTFCMTGQDGLLRQLSVDEILAQVVIARRIKTIRKVLFMGMGEPSHNLAVVMEAIRYLALEGNLARKKIVFSTVGDRRAFSRLASDPIRPALALSLHSTCADTRARLLPRAPRIAPDELVELALHTAGRDRHPLLVQWTLLAGINDDLAEVPHIARLLAGRHAILNAIPWNSGGALPHARPPRARAEAFVQALLDAGVKASLRWSAAQEVEGGCGQLRAQRLLALTNATFLPSQQLADVAAVAKDQQQAH